MGLWQITHCMRNVLLKQAEAGSDEVYAQVSLFPENEVSFFFCNLYVIVYTKKNWSMIRPIHVCKQREKTYKVVNLHKLFKDAKSCQ